MSGDCTTSDGRSSTSNRLKVKYGQLRNKTIAKPIECHVIIERQRFDSNREAKCSNLEALRTTYDETRHHSTISPSNPSVYYQLHDLLTVLLAHSKDEYSWIGGKHNSIVSLSLGCGMADVYDSPFLADRYRWFPYDTSTQAYGWGVLILAGAGSYIWAKQHIDERRRQQEKSGARPREVKNCELYLVRSRMADGSGRAG